MSETAQIITSLATLVAAIGSLIIGWRNTRKIEQVHQATNGLTNRLVDLTATASKAEGNLQGRAELKIEQNGGR